MSNLVFIVDDEKNICELIRLYVEKEGFSTCIAYDGEDAVEKFKEMKPDIVLLDIMLPEKDGWQVCREIRAISATPIIMLTAKGELFDKVLGLELGADDYMVKPFEPKELVARIKAVLRRTAASETEAETEDVLTFEGITINRDTYEVYLGENLLEILNEIWGYEFFGDSRTIDVHRKRIREKIETEGKENLTWQLKTIWGVGYKFEVKA